MLGPGPGFLERPTPVGEWTPGPFVEREVVLAVSGGPERTSGGMQGREKHAAWPGSDHQGVLLVSGRG